MQYFCTVCNEPVSDARQELEPGVVIFCRRCWPPIMVETPVDARIDAQLAKELEASFIYFEQEKKNG
jgi:hypothetical protein